MTTTKYKPVKHDHAAFLEKARGRRGFQATYDAFAITRGTTNVFADLDLPDAVERQSKTRLAHAINKMLNKCKLTQHETAELLGIPQPKVSAIMNYRLDNISAERLIKILVALDQDTEIRIRPRAAKSKNARISVLAGRSKQQKNNRAKPL